MKTLDRYEYKVRAEEIKALVQNKEYHEAMKIADTIDWRRVKSVMMLCTVSDLYKMNRRFDECKELLRLAYERHPGGRMIVYSLCELAIKMGETLQAIEYYKEFVQIAPKDSGRYILQYKLYEAQEVSLEERIAVLEELKKRDYREKWAYELAYLYHRVGLSTKCVEECNELILWFGEGKYVIKAMELKMLHQPLNEVQQQRYNEKTGTAEPMQPLEIEEDVPMPIEIKARDMEDSPTIEIPSKEVDYQVKTIKVGKYDTINLQKELAESMKELMAASEGQQMNDLPMEEVPKDEEELGDVTKALVAPLLAETEEMPILNDEIQQTGQETAAVEEVFFEDSTVEMQPIQEVSPVDPNLAKILSQEYDGQISIVVPEGETLEKQITGQMSIEDILTEWEKMKKENEQKRAEEVRQRVLQQTGSLFSEFDEKTRSGILAQLDEVYENTLKKETPKDLGEIEELEEIEEHSGLTETLPEVEELLEEPEEELEVQIEESEEPLEETEESAEETEAAEVEEPKIRSRNLTDEERELFGSFIQTKKEKNQIVAAVDAMSLAPYTGNVIVTGEAGLGTLDLAKNLIKEVQMSDSNFSGKVAKITGNILNDKNIDKTLTKMNNGALIIEKAGGLKPSTLDNIHKYLEAGKGGIIIILEDTKKAIDNLLADGHKIVQNFNARIDMNSLNNDALVAYGKKYAQELEYTIDDLGVLALYTRIAEMQTSDHVVSAAEVREIVDDAIYHANRKTLKHFMDILLAKRYDEEDMIILRERDFI